MPSSMCVGKENSGLTQMQWDRVRVQEVQQTWMQYFRFVDSEGHTVGTILVGDSNDLKPGLKAIQDALDRHPAAIK